MILTIFIGGMFLGFLMGFLTMALLAVRGRRFQSEEADGDCRIILPATVLPSTSLSLGGGRRRRPPGFS